LGTYLTGTNRIAPADLLSNGIEKMMEDINDGVDVAPFLFLCQSSGYGKTRAVLELAKKKKRVVYLPCEDLLVRWGDSTPGWSVPEALHTLLQELQNEDDAIICERKWIKFLQAVIETADKYPNHTALYKSQVTETGSLGNFYKELNEIWRKAKAPTTSALHQSGKMKSVHFEGGEPLSKDAPRSIYKGPIRITKDSLVVCLDEAAVLSDTASHAFRRMAKSLGIISIFPTRLLLYAM
jgi:hypothetical protein